MMPKNYGNPSMKISLTAWSVGIAILILFSLLIGNMTGPMNFRFLLSYALPFLFISSITLDITACIFGVVALFKSQSRIKAMFVILILTPLNLFFLLLFLAFISSLV